VDPAWRTAPASLSCSLEREPSVDVRRSGNSARGCWIYGVAVFVPMCLRSRSHRAQRDDVAMVTENVWFPKHLIFILTRPIL
jgi:hypothetical protein